MYIETVPNRNSPPAILLREGRRQGDKVIKRTLANLSDWPKEKIETFRRLLRDEPLVSPQDLFSIHKTLPHGHVEAILLTIRKLGLEGIISAKRCPERDLVVAMLVERILHACSKLATTRLWHSTTLAEDLGVGEASEDDLYRAMDWLWERKRRIEKRLAERHLKEGGLVLYDVSSSYYEGRTCPLAYYGHDRDGQKGLPIIVYGLLTDSAGAPVAVETYRGNTGDPTTVPDQVNKLRQEFHLARVVLVGDRGMLTEPKIEKLKQQPRFSGMETKRATRESGWTTWTRCTSTASPPDWRSHFRLPTCRGTSARCTFATPMAMCSVSAGDSSPRSSSSSRTAKAVGESRIGKAPRVSVGQRACIPCISDWAFFEV
jgi:hypothetical protein